MRSQAARVLLVEEDPTLAEITAFRLELLGYAVQMAASADEAFELTASDLPDIIILDLYLSGIDGLELTNRLSNDQRTCQVPILAISTDGDLTKVQRAYAAGAKDYLLLPYDPAVLEKKLERMLRGVAV